MDVTKRFSFPFLKVCFGLRWLRRNDNDSIGDDDRRGVGGPAHRYNGSNPFVRHQPRLHRRRQSATPEQPFGVFPMAIKCSRVDVVTHLKSDDRNAESKRPCQQEANNSELADNLEKENSFAK